MPASQLATAAALAGAYDYGDTPIFGNSRSPVRLGRGAGDGRALSCNGWYRPNQSAISSGGRSECALYTSIWKPNFIKSGRHCSATGLTPAAACAGRRACSSA